jgi:hypothetical protein
MRKHIRDTKKDSMETIGIGLGDKMSRYCMVNREGEVVEEGSFRNQVSSIETHFSGERRRIALEAGAQSAWISRELERLGHQVIVANVRQVESGLPPATPRTMRRTRASWLYWRGPMRNCWRRWNIARPNNRASYQ